MAERLTDGSVRRLPAPLNGNRIAYDEEVKGFGVRVTAAGAKAFILNYRAEGRERRITLGSFPGLDREGGETAGKGVKAKDRRR